MSVCLSMCMSIYVVIYNILFTYKIFYLKKYCSTFTLHCKFSAIKAIHCDNPITNKQALNVFQEDISVSQLISFQYYFVQILRAMNNLITVCLSFRYRRVSKRFFHLSHNTARRGNDSEPVFHIRQ